MRRNPLFGVKTYGWQNIRTAAAYVPQAYAQWSLPRYRWLRGRKALQVARVSAAPAGRQAWRYAGVKQGWRRVSRVFAAALNVKFPKCHESQFIAIPMPAANQLTQNQQRLFIRSVPRNQAKYEEPRAQRAFLFGSARALPIEREPNARQGCCEVVGRAREGVCGEPGHGNKQVRGAVVRVRVELGLRRL